METVVENPAKGLTDDEEKELAKLDELYFSQPFMAEEDGRRRAELIRKKEALTNKPAYRRAFYLFAMMANTEA